MTLKKSRSYEEALQMLPAELVPILDVFIDHYRFAVLKHHGGYMYSPKVLAELILLGWRDSANPIGSAIKTAPQ